jgi:hypothetical protein
MARSLTDGPDRRDPTYLGDGVYAAHDGCQIWLRANNADWERPTDMTDIALEPPVLMALVSYAKRIGMIEKEP